jgi:hypothetical protein
LQTGELMLAYLVFGLDPEAYWRENATLAGALVWPRNCPCRGHRCCSC